MCFPLVLSTLQTVGKTAENMFRPLPPLMVKKQQLNINDENYTYNSNNGKQHLEKHKKV